MSVADPMSDSGATYDCVVVGGGVAGLSAAMVLGRARRRTLLVDRGGQSNRAAGHVGGLLGHDGTPPAELYSAGANRSGPMTRSSSATQRWSTPRATAPASR